MLLRIKKIVESKQSESLQGMAELWRNLLNKIKRRVVLGFIFSIVGLKEIKKKDYKGRFFTVFSLIVLLMGLFFNKNF